MRPVIVLVAKSPIAGAVKTRMCPPLTPREAASLAGCLLQDTAEVACAVARSVGGDVWCSYAGHLAPLAALLPAAIELVPQHGAGLAERLAAVQADACAAGYDAHVLLGADCPTVTEDDLADALTLLGDDAADVVLGPARDGGYTLLAARRATPAVFDGVEMGTSRVTAQTIARATQAGLRLARTRCRHDIDRVVDLMTALETGELEGAPRTRAAARDLMARVGTAV